MRGYNGHIPTGRFGKLLLGADAAVRALVDPREARLVGIVGEVTGGRALRRIHDRMQRHPVGRAVLADRPSPCNGEQPKSANCTSWSTGSSDLELSNVITDPCHHENLLAYQFCVTKC